jgi:hemoglobin
MTSFDNFVNLRNGVGAPRAGIFERREVWAEPTLYERLGGIYAIAAVVDHFSDQLLKNPQVVEANPELKEWRTATFAGRLPGLKFLRTLWVAALAPFQWASLLVGEGEIRF